MRLKNQRFYLKTWTRSKASSTNLLTIISKRFANVFVNLLINSAQDYTEKVRKMISAVMNDADIEGDKEKAAALMKVLTEVHTKLV